MLKSDAVKRTAAYVIEFIIYSFLGWLYETVCESIFAGGFVLNEGFLCHLPVCPIYGVGAFIALGIMYRIGNLNKLKVFIGGTVITTVVEYIAAIILESILNKKLWDYTPWILDFQGRISVISSLIFGFGCVLGYWLHPRCMAYCLKRQWTVAVAVLCLLAMVIDFIIVVSGLI